MQAKRTSPICSATHESMVVPTPFFNQKNNNKRILSQIIRAPHRACYRWRHQTYKVLNTKNYKAMRQICRAQVTSKPQWSQKLQGQLTPEYSKRMRSGLKRSIRSRTRIWTSTRLRVENKLQARLNLSSSQVTNRLIRSMTIPRISQ